MGANTMPVYNDLGRHLVPAMIVKGQETHRW